MRQATGAWSEAQDTNAARTWAVSGGGEPATEESAPEEEGRDASVPELSDADWLPRQPLAIRQSPAARELAVQSSERTDM